LLLSADFVFFCQQISNSPSKSGTFFLEIGQDGCKKGNFMLISELKDFFRKCSNKILNFFYAHFYLREKKSLLAWIFFKNFMTQIFETPSTKAMNILTNLSVFLAQDRIAYPKSKNDLQF
jgi:hypothetical protein